MWEGEGRRVTRSDLIAIRWDHACSHCFDWRAVWLLFTNPSSSSGLLEVTYSISGQMTAKKFIRLCQRQPLWFLPCAPCPDLEASHRLGDVSSLSTAAVPRPTPHHMFPLSPVPALRKLEGQWLWQELGLLGTRAGMGLGLGTGGKLDYRAWSKENPKIACWIWRRL